MSKNRLGFLMFGIVGGLLGAITAQIIFWMVFR